MTKRNEKFSRLIDFLPEGIKETIEEDYDIAEQQYFEKHGKYCYRNFQTFELAERCFNSTSKLSSQHRG